MTATGVRSFLSLYFYPLVVAFHLHEGPDDIYVLCPGDENIPVGEEEMNLSRQSWELYLNLSHLKQSQLQAAQLQAGRLSPLSTPASVSLEGRLTLPSWRTTQTPVLQKRLLSPISLETKMPTGTPEIC